MKHIKPFASMNEGRDWKKQIADDFEVLKKAFPHFSEFNNKEIQLKATLEEPHIEERESHSSPGYIIITKEVGEDVTARVVVEYVNGKFEAVQNVFSATEDDEKESISTDDPEDIIFFTDDFFSEDFTDYESDEDDDN